MKPATTEAAEDLQKPGSEHVEAPTAVKIAVGTLTAALRADPSFYYAYQANIAMAFKDEFERWRKRTQKDRPSSEDVHGIANAAAVNFLNLWTRDPAREAQNAG